MGKVGCADTARQRRHHSGLETTRKRNGSKFRNDRKADTMNDPTKPNPSESALRVTDSSAAQQPDGKRGRGKLLTDSAIASTTVITEYTRKSDESADIFHALEMQAISIHAGDQTQMEAMLINQAVALQTMFMDLAVRAKKQSSMDAVQCLTSINRMETAINPVNRSTCPPWSVAVLRLCTSS